MKPEHELWACHQLKAIRHGIDQLVAMESGLFVAVPRRIIINAQNPFFTFEVKGDGEFHSVQIDNPSAVDVDVSIGGRQPDAASSDARVPAHTSRILTFPYSELSIGIDPAAVPAGNTIVYVRYYARPLTPSISAFAP